MKNSDSNPMKDRTKELEQSLVSMDKKVNDYKTAINVAKMQPTVKGYSSYNGQNAANYALTWAKSKNPSYTFYENADCTNFVSQAMVAGGLPTDRTWYKDSNAWIRVIELRNWLVNKGYASEYKGNWAAGPGNIVQFNNGSKWSHSVIITANKPNTGEVFVTAHSDPQKNIPIGIYYAKNKDSRFLVIK